LLSECSSRIASKGIVGPLCSVWTKSKVNKRGDVREGSPCSFRGIPSTVFVRTESSFCTGLTRSKKSRLLFCCSLPALSRPSSETLKKIDHEYGVPDAFCISARGRCKAPGVFHLRVAVSFVSELVLDAEFTAICDNPHAICLRYSLPNRSERVGCVRKAQVSKNTNRCTHPADVVRVAGSGA
jgi:hypothetical protein